MAKYMVVTDNLPDEQAGYKIHRRYEIVSYTKAYFFQNGYKQHIDNVVCINEAGNKVVFNAAVLAEMDVTRY